MRTIDKVVIHHSDSQWGNAVVIDSWHRQRGWHGIGYHYVILNGSPYSGTYNTVLDGLIETGRAVETEGAHAVGHNETSIGICLIGKSGVFTEPQYKRLASLLKAIKEEHGDVSVYMHSQLNPDKPLCPGIDPCVLLEVMANG